MSRYDVPERWSLPRALGELTALEEPAAAQSTVRYLDTAHRDLLACGALLCRRSEGDEVLWQLWLPGAQRPVEEPGTTRGSALPATIRRLSVGLRAGSEVRTVLGAQTRHAAARVIIGGASAEPEPRHEQAAPQPKAPQPEPAVASGSMPEPGAAAAPDATAAPDAAAEPGASTLTIETAEPTPPPPAVIAPVPAPIVSIFDERTTATTHEQPPAPGNTAEPITATESRTVRWRQLRVFSDEQAAAERLGELLTAAGAQPDGHDHLAELLDQLTERARATSGGIDARSVGALVADYLRVQRAAILAGDVALRKGKEKVIHPTRVAIRRYRSVLRIFGNLFDAERAAQLDVELRWLAGALSGVRDLQVIGARLEQQLTTLPPALRDATARRRIHEALRREGKAASALVVRTLGSRRYFALLRDLRDFTQDPPWTPTAERRAKIAREYLAAAERKVTRRRRQAQRVAARADELADPLARQAITPPAMHRARKAAKRARYTAELIASQLGQEATDAVTRFTAVQDQLGGAQDAVVTFEFLLHLGAVRTLSPATARTIGLLMGMQHEQIIGAVA